MRRSEHFVIDYTYYSSISPRLAEFMAQQGIRCRQYLPTQKDADREERRALRRYRLLYRPARWWQLLVCWQ